MQNMKILLIITVTPCVTISLHFADWCLFLDSSLCYGCSLCISLVQAVIPRNRGKSLQQRWEYQSVLWVCTVYWSDHFFFSVFFFFLLYSLELNNFFELPSDEQNILEAASSGASASIGLVANIAANLIAFLAILAFINQALSWLGGMVGYPDITFEVCFSKTWIWWLWDFDTVQYFLDF